MLNYFISAILLIVMIFFEATQPPTIGSSIIPHLDKIAHFFAFGLLAFLLIMAFRPSGVAIQWSDVIVVCIIVLSITVADELVQTLNATRQASLGDITAGCLGAFSVSSVMKFRRNRIR